ncbi:lysophospholipase [Aureobasidium subglaciale]|nr:lysophospholipase [Aureobasidium subglaciale]KAI5222426.1 lysophospholipase [Aureobasidium subglaciale]KAI5223315.1 lysophospholipase [Aureobasidium subglaciale]KAI5259950.1 lysophospholipase [Aureobasidium subglaciale]
MAPYAAILQLSLLAGHASAAAIDTRSLTPYAPVSASCPSTPLVRTANSLGSDEATYIAARKPQADAALAAWLQKTDSSFATTNLPTVGLVLSGGGYRALLSGAGLVQGLDARDSDLSTSGLYQAMTYETSLSGGAWFSTSWTGLNWPTVSYLRDNLWSQSFADSLLVPARLLSAVAYAEIVKDIVDKAKAGFPPTLIDVYGRLLSYQLLTTNSQDIRTDGAVSKTFSSVVSSSNFTSHAVPFPIITARGVNTFEGQCIPRENGTQYEFAKHDPLTVQQTPYEFGSWDSDINAFTPTAYLGSKLTNGAPTISNQCIKNYDNLGYVAGTSSALFNNYCSTVPAKNNTQSLAQTLQAIVLNAHSPVTRDLYAPYPNPFYKYPASTLTNAQSEIQIVDGGEGNSAMPFWPLIQPERKVDVIIAADNGADTSDLFPSGTAIVGAYEQALAAGLTRMPFIPSLDTFISSGLNKHAVFFGCDTSDTVTIVYLPNNNYTYASNIETVIIQTSEQETAGIIENGNAIATQNGDEQWPVCLGCAVMKKTGSVLPEACTACFDKYCYSG